MATKEQERKALAKIEAILKELGEDSYIGIAMTGVIQDAKDNIENDWAASRYDAWQSAEQRADKAEAALLTMTAKAEELQLEKENLAAKVLTASEASMVVSLLGEYRYDLNTEIEATAKKIVIYADDVEGKEFKDAVWQNRLAAGREKQVLEAMEAVRAKNIEQ